MGKGVVRLGRACRRCASRISAPAEGIASCGIAGCVEAMKEGLGGKFLGTSNVLQAMELRHRGDRDQRPRAADGAGHDGRRRSAVCCALPTACSKAGSARTKGTSSSCCRTLTGRAPSCAMPRPGWRSGAGSAIDSKDPVEGGEEIISWWKAMGQGPAGEAPDLLRRPGHRQYRKGLPPLHRPRPPGVRLGHVADQRSARLRAGEETRTSIPSPWSAR